MDSTVKVLKILQKHKLLQIMKLKVKI